MGRYFRSTSHSLTGLSCTLCNLNISNGLGSPRIWLCLISTHADGFDLFRCHWCSNTYSLIVLCYLHESKRHYNGSVLVQIDRILLNALTYWIDYLQYPPLVDPSATPSRDSSLTHILITTLLLICLSDTIWHHFATFLGQIMRGCLSSRMFLLYYRPYLLLLSSLAQGAVREQARLLVGWLLGGVGGWTHKQQIGSVEGSSVVGSVDFTQQKRFLHLIIIGMIGHMQSLFLISFAQQPLGVSVLGNWSSYIPRQFLGDSTEHQKWRSHHLVWLSQDLWL